MTLMGLLPENGQILSGTIDFDGHDLARLEETAWQKIRGKDIAMIFQAAMNALNPVFRVDEQVREAIVTHQPHISETGLSDRVRELFDLVEIPAARMKDYPHEYSGGMKQRVIIAMALACNPQLIIADEPTTALDVIVQDQILKEIRAVRKAMDMGLIFISHDIAVVASVCRDICVMYAGQIVEKGTCEEVFSAPRHPYTQTLLGSYLSLDHENDVAVPDMAESPDLAGAQDGCCFSRYCPCCSGRCQETAPQWIRISRTHQALCCHESVIQEAP
jgi:peptide/nickel transport system ATP-binding protein